MNKEPANKRIGGIDLARAIAMLGMLIVNFEIVTGAHQNGSPLLVASTALLHGKAAALFVILSGIGVTLMSSRLDAGVLLLRRAIVLLVGGLAFSLFWPGDILHFYGLYIIVAVAFLRSSNRSLLVASIAAGLAFVPMMLLFDYDAGWDWTSLEYQNMWTIEGLARRLLFNGFHPLVPWVGFFLGGMWIGRLELGKADIRRRLLYAGLGLWAIGELASRAAIHLLSKNFPKAPLELIEALGGTAPIPPLPIYLLVGAGSALVVLALSLAAAERMPRSRLVQSLRTTGQMSLTVYLAHALIGMTLLGVFGLIDEPTPSSGVSESSAIVDSEFELPSEGTRELSVVAPESKEQVEPGSPPSLGFILAFAIVFWLLMILFAVAWRRRFRSGPAEWLLRWLSLSSRAPPKPAPSNSRQRKGEATNSSPSA